MATSRGTAPVAAPLPAWRKNADAFLSFALRGRSKTMTDVPMPTPTALFRAGRVRPVLLALGAVLAVLAAVFFIVSSGSGEVTRWERDLLYRTDHAAVLAACGEVFAN